MPTPSFFEVRKTLFGELGRMTHGDITARLGNTERLRVEMRLDPKAPNGRAMIHQCH